MSPHISIATRETVDFPPTMNVRFGSLRSGLPTRSIVKRFGKATRVYLSEHATVPSLLVVCKSLRRIGTVWRMTDTYGRRWEWAPALRFPCSYPVQPGSSFFARIYWHRDGTDDDWRAPVFSLIAKSDEQYQRWRYARFR